MKRGEASAGLAAGVYEAGNVVGRLQCEVSRRAAIELGSQFDTVCGGGVWDGAYGVLAVIGVAERLARQRGRACKLPFDVAAIAFDDDEGNIAFGTTQI